MKIWSKFGLVVASLGFATKDDVFEVVKLHFEVVKVCESAFCVAGVGLRGIQACRQNFAWCEVGTIEWRV